MDAIENGIGMVHQHFMLIPSFTVAQNIVLGSEPRKAAFIDMKEAVRRTQELAHKYHFDIDVTEKVENLTVGAKQKVEILKTLYRNAEVIILDEPTAVLTPQETEALFAQLKTFKEIGHTIVFISHKLGEVKQISDRVTVIRNGETKGTYAAADVTIDKLTELIIGSKLESSYDGLKKPVEEPKAVQRLQYIPEEQTGVLMATGMESIYRLSDNVQTNAGNYTATAELIDKENYRWLTQPEDGTGVVTIPWTISPRTLTKPNLVYTSAVTYDGKAHIAIQDTSAKDYEGEFDADGTLTVYYIGTDGEYREDEVVAFTVTDAQKTEAGTYTPHVDLSIPNFQWSDQTAVDYNMGSWTISQKQVSYPQLTVKGSPTYDGKAFDEENKYLVAEAPPKGMAFTGYRYGTSSMGPF